MRREIEATEEQRKSLWCHLNDWALRTCDLDAPGRGLICQVELYCRDGAGQGPRRVEEDEKKGKKDEERGEVKSEC